MQPLDFSPIANAPLNAMQAAAYGDAMQANQLQNRIAELSFAELQKKQVDAKAYNQLLGESWQPAQPTTNRLAAPKAPAQQPSGMDPLMAAQRQASPQAATLYGEMAQVPGGTAQPAAAPAATPPTDQFTAQRQALAAAFNEGRVTREQAAAFDQQITAAEQAATAPRTASKLAFYKDLMGKAAEAGDNEGFQALAKQAQSDPDVKGMIPDTTTLQVTGKQQLEVTRPFTAEELAGLAAKHPELGIPANATPGLYKLTTKGGKPVGWEPKDPKEPVGVEGAYLDGLKAQIRGKNPTWDPKRVEFEAAKQVRAENLAASQQRTKFTFDLKNSGAGAAAPDDFTKWGVADKEWWFETKKATGEKPDFGWGKAAAKSRVQFAKEYSQWAQGKGISGAEAGTSKESFKADAKSLAFNTKQLDASKSFIKTIDNNIDQLERHITTMSKILNLDRNRLLNMGTRDFNKRLVGVANINVYDMLVSAISTENAKLQAGGAGSVAQVSEGARVDMERIHDKNLPVSEMLKLMAATREEGGNRIKALNDTGEEIKVRMRGAKPASGTPAIPHFESAKARTAKYMNGNWDNLNRKKSMWNTLKQAQYTDAQALAIYDAAKRGQ